MAIKVTTTVVLVILPGVVGVTAKAKAHVTVERNVGNTQTQTQTQAQAQTQTRLFLFPGFSKGWDSGKLS
jgi:hypothetical protein